MPLDAVCLRAVLSELNTRIAGARIEKVYQPDREEIVLQLRGGQGRAPRSAGCREQGAEDAALQWRAPQPQPQLFPVHHLLTPGGGTLRDHHGPFSEGELSKVLP